MNTSRPILPLVFCLLLSWAYGQETPELTAKDSIVKKSWIVTLGTNFVDDSGDEFGNLFDIQDGWNAVPYPSRLSIGHYFESGLGLEAIASYNRYKEGNIIDNVPITEDVSYMGLDFRVSYDLNMILGETGFFDPYVGIGVGYTDANNQGRGTYNAVVGFRTWFSDRWGLDFNSTGKWTMNTDNSSNHIQHGLGLAYRFGIEKGLSKKGEEKKALLDELAKEQQRIQDSIAAKEKADEEARLLAERLQREKEAAELAAAEKARRDAEEARRAKISSEIDGLGKVYFRLNSSYLSVADKQNLDKLVDILNSNPTLIIKIGGHTDSRGSSKYNQWLSERRAKRTLDYVLAKGIPEDRISVEGFGETQLTNECADGVSCSEAKHAKNRRSAFEIVQY
ncbi:OmpA family protein [Muricauda sp. 2012CJ35-5]|uniref:OmpA family protein n=1 Tax=Flagellimonas spongiicola TaxID=2942208 RepID=A0ABT0PVV9_9FLAO|nr:OmpA family protein [Allomuricauda spongiicola]MCL6275525.1 OmpA family protein [Allomuricauda spongiicola]